MLVLPKESGSRQVSVSEAPQGSQRDPSAEILGWQEETVSAAKPEEIKMIKSFVIEVNTEDNFVRVFEVAREYTADHDPQRGVAYHRAATDIGVVRNIGVNPRLWGKLDALLVTHEKIENAAPIEPMNEPTSPPLFKENA